MLESWPAPPPASCAGLPVQGSGISEVGQLGCSTAPGAVPVLVCRSHHNLVLADSFPYLGMLPACCAARDALSVVQSCRKEQALGQVTRSVPLRLCWCCRQARPLQSAPEHCVPTRAALPAMQVLALPASALEKRFGPQRAAFITAAMHGCSDEPVTVRSRTVLLGRLLRLVIQQRRLMLWGARPSSVAQYALAQPGYQSNPEAPMATKGAMHLAAEGSLALCAACVAHCKRGNQGSVQAPVLVSASARAARGSACSPLSGGTDQHGFSSAASTLWQWIWMIPSAH